MNVPRKNVNRCFFTTAMVSSPRVISYVVPPGQQLLADQGQLVPCMSWNESLSPKESARPST